ncbi:MAG TPA: hypothetical protein PLG17_09100 [Thermodesulfobacteriota bacterium]|nr:hypothetical protein [Thermodesulfobacteriota bacterium]
MDSRLRGNDELAHSVPHENVTNGAEATENSGQLNKSFRALPLRVEISSISTRQADKDLNVIPSVDEELMRRPRRRESRTELLWWKAGMNAGYYFALSKRDLACQQVLGMHEAVALTLLEVSASSSFNGIG